VSEPGRRVALVTGSSRGIGQAIAERLAADGAAIAVHCASRIEAAEAVAAGLPEGRAFRADVSDPDAVERLFGEIETTLGPVDVLVNNAGVHRGGRIGTLSLEDWRLTVGTSLEGSFLCARRSVPSMVERGWGRIVTVSSPVALRGYAGDTAYGAAKAGQLGMTRCLAAELASTGVTANAVIPGFVETEMTGGLSDRARERLIAGLPTGRPVEAAEVAAAVAFLVGDGAAQVTGVTLPADGGLTI
jgi:3-oxoacyl-[acyl-carrier protein] reductase